MARVSLKRNINVGRVVAKIATTVLALWVGGTIVSEIGDVLNCTASPFYKGLTLIGWTISTGVSPGGAGNVFCNGTSNTISSGSSVITATSGTGVLSVVGLIGIASIIMEFVEFKL